MNTILRVFIYIVAIIVISSCTTTEKFYINVPEETNISLPMEGNIEKQNNNKMERKITIPSEGYCGYVLANVPGSSTPIPLGLNLKKNKHTGTKALLGGAYVLTGAGLGGLIGGTITVIGASANKDEDVQSVGGAIVGLSAGVAAIGAGMGITSQSRLRQTSYDYSFGYEKHQKLDIPQLSTTLINPNSAKDTPVNQDEKKSIRKKATSDNSTQTKSSVGSKVNKSRSSLANKVIGNYKGTGRLLRNEIQEDFYSKIEIDITPIDKNTVKVRIIEGGEDFFEEPLIYKVSNDKKGNYQLNIEKIVGAVITITNTGVLNFNHPKVNIDDTMYNLVIKANRNQKN